MQLLEAVIGKRVAYIPPHAFGDILHEDVDYGEIRSINNLARMIFAAFDADVKINGQMAVAKGCHPNNLVYFSCVAKSVGEAKTMAFKNSDITQLRDAGEMDESCFRAVDRIIAIARAGANAIGATCSAVIDVDSLSVYITAVRPESHIRNLATWRGGLSFSRRDIQRMNCEEMDYRVRGYVADLVCSAVRGAMDDQIRQMSPQDTASPPAPEKTADGPPSH